MQLDLTATTQALTSCCAAFVPLSLYVVRYDVPNFSDMQGTKENTVVTLLLASGAAPKPSKPDLQPRVLSRTMRPDGHKGTRLAVPAARFGRPRRYSETGQNTTPSGPPAPSSSQSQAHTSPSCSGGHAPASVTSADPPSELLAAATSPGRGRRPQCPCRRLKAGPEPGALVCSPPKRQGEREKGGASARAHSEPPYPLGGEASRPGPERRGEEHGGPNCQSFPAAPGADPRRARDARRARSGARPSASGAASRSLRRGRGGARGRAGAAGASWAETSRGEGRGEDQPAP